MKKMISILLVAVMLLGLVTCVPPWQQVDPTEPPEDPTNPKPTAPSDPSDPSDGPTAPPEDYYSFGPEEMIIAKAGVTYVKHDSQIDGKDVYALTSQGWTGEIWAEHTSHYLNDEVICTPNEKREELIYKQYKYAAITFQLSEGAQIGLYHTVPMITEDFKGEMVGFIFKAGGTLTHNPNYLDVYSDRFAIFTEGKQIHLGDTINAGQWYTYVCELHLDVDNSLYGPDTYVNVSMTNGNSKPVYVSEVRFYTNDTYLTDYVTESTDPEPTDPEPTAPLADYVEMDATELVSYKTGKEDAYTNQGEVFGRTDVYGAELLANWSVELMAKNTAAATTYAGSAFADWNAVRQNFKDNGYQYIAIDFALSEGATVRAIGCLPATTEGGNVVTAGLTFTDGAALSYSSLVATDEQKSYFAVYCEGKEVAIGDTIEAGKWYTVVIKLLVNGDQYGQGKDGWSSVAFNVGNGKMIYFSTVRYYTNDTYKTDYVTETTDSDVTVPTEPEATEPETT